MLQLTGSSKLNPSSSQDTILKKATVNHTPNKLKKQFYSIKIKEVQLSRNTRLNAWTTLIVIAFSTLENHLLYRSDHEESFLISCLKILIGGLSIFQAYLVLLYYKIFLTLTSVKELFLRKTFAKNSEVYRFLIFEVALNLVFMPPFLYHNRVYHIDAYNQISLEDVILVLIYCRSYQIFKYIHYRSPFNSILGRIICNLAKRSYDYRFSFKFYNTCLLYTSPSPRDS